MLEGDTVHVIFKRNVKNETQFPLLTIEGRIVSEDKNADGKSESSETSENVYTLWKAISKGHFVLPYTSTSKYRTPLNKVHFKRLQGVLYLKVSLYNWSQASSLLSAFIPVSDTLLRREESKTISVTARDDYIALEDGDKIILRHTSGIDNYVIAVEQRGEFIRYTTEVIIIDKNGKS